MKFLMAIVALLVLFAAVYYLTRRPETDRESALNTQEREELDGLRTLVDDLKEIAWDHRELDSSLSIILIDKIRSFERRNRRELP